MKSYVWFIFGGLAGIVLVAAALSLGLVKLGGKEAKPFHSTPKNNCTDTSAKCEVTVTLDCATNLCTISLDFDPIVVNTGKRRIDLTWQLVDVTNGYTFTDTDIQIIGDDTNEFSCGVMPGTNGKRFKCTDQNSQFGVFKYVIHVTGQNPVTPLDPWVVND